MSENNGWQPIETAPRDGSALDVWVPSDAGGYRVTNLTFSPAGRLLYGCNEAYLLRWPTHWMPLPAGPVTDLSLTPEQMA